MEGQPTTQASAVTPLPIRLPAAQIVVPDIGYSAAALESVEKQVVGGACTNGYLFVERGNGSDMMLFYQGAVHSAVKLQGPELVKHELAKFFEDFKHIPTRRMRLCRTDVGLVLLMAVVSQNKPTLKVPGSIADVEKILSDLKTRGKPACILITRGTDRNFVYCRDGAPVAIYFADEANRPTDATVADQILAYGYADPETTTFEVFHDLQSTKDEHAGRPFDELLRGQLGPPPFFLVVRKGKEVVVKRLIQDGKAKTGRDPANDIVIDDRSVSRRHCVIEWKAGQYVVTDCGSANRTRVNGVAVDESPLSPGDKITVGDFEISFGEDQDQQSKEELQTLFLEGPSAEDDPAAQLVFNGESIPIKQTVFTMGKSVDALLQLKGLFMKPVQATIIHDDGGKYRLFATGGGKAVKLDGAEVGPSGTVIQSGSKITIGKHVLVFVVTEKPGS